MAAIQIFSWLYGSIIHFLRNKYLLNFALKEYWITFVRNFTKYEMKVSIFTEKQTQTARYAKALSHPVRVYILELLSKQACCYSGDLSDELPIAKSTLSQHLKELKEAGLIQGEIEAPKIKYCLNKTAWHEAGQLIETLFNKEIQTDDLCSTEK